MKHIVYTLNNDTSLQKSKLSKAYTKVSGVVASAVAAAALLFAPVMAHAPVVALDPIGPQSYATFPQVYSVTGEVCHSNPGNVSAVSELKLLINSVQEGVTVNPNFANAPCADFNMPWNITGPGTYTVTVTARHGNDTGTDFEEVVVSGTVVIGQCKAAPAIANELLKAQLVKPKATTISNYVSQVAKYMGPQTDFNGVSACDVTDYRNAVNNYLDNVINAY